MGGTFCHHDPEKPDPFPTDNKTGFGSDCEERRDPDPT